MGRPAQWRLILINATHKGLKLAIAGWEPSWDREAAAEDRIGAGEASPTMRTEGRGSRAAAVLGYLSVRQRGRANKGQAGGFGVDLLNGYGPGGTGAGVGANASLTTRITFSRRPSTTGTRPPNSSRASST